MPQAVAERLQAEFGLTFAEGYGLTETAAPTHSNPPERAKLQCLGIPIFGTDARIIDPDTLQEVPQARWARSSPTARWSSRATGATPTPRARPSSTIDGKRFFRTGDLGRMDEEGYFFITDRLKRMINASGFKVWPARWNCCCSSARWCRRPA
jgi:fatty-acyl-CoA synthase